MVRSKLRQVGTALLVLLGGVMDFPNSTVVSAEFTHGMFRNKLTLHFPVLVFVDRRERQKFG